MEKNKLKLDRFFCQVSGYMYLGLVFKLFVDIITQVSMTCVCAMCLYSECVTTWGGVGWRGGGNCLLAEIGVLPRDGRFGSKVGQIGSKWARGAKCTEI